MVENKTIGYSVIALLIGLSSMYGIDYLTDDNVYYCESTSTIMQCDELSKYYGLENGKCWNVEGNKLCRSGWIEIVDDTPIEPSGNLSETRQCCNPDSCYIPVKNEVCPVKID